MSEEETKENQKRRSLVGLWHVCKTWGKIYTLSLKKSHTFVRINILCCKIEADSGMSYSKIIHFKNNYEMIVQYCGCHWIATMYVVCNVN